MISHSHKFILILPAKTASTSISNSLLSYVNISKIKTQKDLNTFDFFEKSEDYISTGKVKLRKHALLSSYHELHLKSYKLFCTIRNPFDRACSAWRWKSKRSKIKFKEYIVNIDMNNHINQTQLSYVDHHSIKLSDIYFIKYENIQEDFNMACNKIGIPRKELPHENKSNHKHYTEYYDDETLQIVTEKYAKDIEYFDYKFGE